MPLTFPPTPGADEEFTSGALTWVWKDGQRWDRKFGTLATLTGIDPTEYGLTGSGHILSCMGTGFVQGTSKIQLDGVAVPNTEFWGATLLKAAVAAPTVTTVKQVTVSGATGQHALTYKGPDPVAILDRLEPDYVFTGRTTMVRHIGNNFEATDIAVWDNVDLATTFVSAQELQATCPVSAIPDTADVVVRKGAANSNLKTFEYRPAPAQATLTALVPNNISVSAPFANVTLRGAGFYTGIPISFPGCSIQTVTNVSSSEMVLYIQSDRVAQTVPVKVGEPGFESNSINFRFV